MKLIALTGLVFVEKVALAKVVAGREVAQGRSVVILDNGGRMPLKADTLAVPVIRLDDDMNRGLPRALRNSAAEIFILIVSEYMQPDAAFISLDALYEEFPDLDVRIVALIDTRTCDCFPQVRDQFESFADVVISLPVVFEEVHL